MAFLEILDRQLHHLLGRISATWAIAVQTFLSLLGRKCFYYCKIINLQFQYFVFSIATCNRMVLSYRLRPFFQPVTPLSGMFKNYWSKQARCERKDMSRYLSPELLCCLVPCALTKLGK